MIVLLLTWYKMFMYSYLTLNPNSFKQNPSGQSHCIWSNTLIYPPTRSLCDDQVVSMSFEPPEHSQSVILETCNLFILISLSYPPPSSVRTFAECSLRTCFLIITLEQPTKSPWKLRIEVKISVSELKIICTWGRKFLPEVASFYLR
jgi:hypothetical protein